MENTTKTCLICDHYQATTHHTDADSAYIHQTCPRCLEFKIAKKAIDTLTHYRLWAAHRNNDVSTLMRILNWMLKKNQLDEIPLITYNIIDDFSRSNEPIPSLNDRAKILLQEIIYQLKPSFSKFEFESNIHFATISFSRNIEETFLLLRYLADLSLIQIQPCKNNIKSEPQYKITPQGYAYFENSNTVCVLCKNKNTHSNHIVEYHYFQWFNLNEIIVQNKDIDSDGYHQACPYCGEFKISQTALDLLNYQHDGEHDQYTKEVENWIFAKNSGSAHHEEISRTAFVLYKHQQINNHDQYLKKISGWISAQNSAGEIPTITKNNLNNILSLTLPQVLDRATLILRTASKNIQWAGSHFFGYKPQYYGISYSTEINEIHYLFDLLIEKKFITNGIPPANSSVNGRETGWFEILPQGHIYLNEQKSRTSSSHQGFVAMWFDPDLNTAYNDGIQTGILNAGYSSVRMDRTEHVNSIDDEMIVQIKASKFVVADFTGHRGNVYFEAGYAMGLNIPVIWSCRKDHVSDLLFDIRQFNYIRWETPEELAERLRLRIEAIIGPGPNKLMSII